MRLEVRGARPLDKDPGLSAWTRDLAAPAAGFRDRTPISREVIDTFADVMCRRVSPVLLGNPESEEVLSDTRDTGTVVLSSDKKIAELYRDVTLRLGHNGFSEEWEPRIRFVAGTENPIFFPRTISPKSIVNDPNDGTGDRLKGTRGTASGDGFSSLVSLLDGDIPVGGLCLRPAHRELWIFDGSEIELWQIDGAGDRSRVAFHRPTRAPGDPTVVRVNTRPAYPETNLPQAVFDLASELSGGRFRFEMRQAGGAGDCLARLIRGDLDMVVSGRKTDWKCWDRDLFVRPIVALGGELGTYLVSHEEISRARCEDPWCTTGVLAHVGMPEAAKFLRLAIAMLGESDKADDGFPLIYHPKKLQA